MKAYFKSELAMMANVSMSTFTRWVQCHREELSRMGVNPKAKVLPPIAVKYLCDVYGITIDESYFTRSRY